MKLRRSLSYVLAVLLILMGAAATTTATAEAKRVAGVSIEDVMSRMPAVGTTVTDVVVIPDHLVAKSLTVTAQGATTTATVAFHEASGSTIDATLNWTSNCDWSLAFQGVGSHREGEDIAPTSITGDITVAACSHPVVNLAVNNYRFANKSNLSATLFIGNGGFHFTVTVTDLEVGGLKLETATLVVNTLETYVQVTGTAKIAHLGTFNVALKVAKIHAGSTTPVCFPTEGEAKCITPSANSADAAVMYVAFSGSDFEFNDAATFQLHSFSFATVAHVPHTGCATYGGSFSGKAKVKGTDLTIFDSGLQFHCSSLEHLFFHVEVAHTDPVSNTTLTAKLKIAWQSGSGSFTQHEGTEVEAGKFTDTTSNVTYDQAFIGTIDLSKTRTFSKKYKDRTFHKSVTMGLVFGIALYKKNGSSAWNSYVGLGGYFDADRVSGGIGCVYSTEDKDFSCGGKIRINPSWAGVYHYWWQV